MRLHAAWNAWLKAVPGLPPSAAANAPWPASPAPCVQSPAAQAGSSGYMLISRLPAGTGAGTSGRAAGGCRLAQMPRRRHCRSGAGAANSACVAAHVFARVLHLHRHPPGALRGRGRGGCKEPCLSCRRGWAPAGRTKPPCSDLSWVWEPGGGHRPSQQAEAKGIFGGGPPFRAVT